jgi:membrane protein
MRTLPASVDRAPRSTGALIGAAVVYALISLAAAIQNRSRPRASELGHDATSRKPNDNSAILERDDEPQGSQGDRSKQDGRGRRAAVPWHIPWRGWKDIFWRTYNQISEDRLLAVAAGVVFYGLLAVFPALTALVSLYGLFADPSRISDHLSLLSGLLPEGAMSIIREQVNRITAKGGTQLGLAFVFGLAVAFWSANAGMKALIDALNVIYGEKEKRGFIALNLQSLALTLGGMLAILVAVAAIVILPIVLTYVGLGGWTEFILRISRWPTLLLLVIVGLAVLYRFGPSREEPRWEWLSVGSVLAAVAWLISSVLLSWYLSNFANYDATYGSLGAAIGMMMWMWISSIIILFGAELNSEIEHQTVRDSTTGQEKPLGQRGATMADTVGASADSH